MKNSIISPRSCRRILVLLPFLAMAFLINSSESADFSTYCQYPPYVFQSKLPSVMLLVSNSYSMSGFAYHTKPADSEANADDSYIPGHRYYGLFNPDFWYDSNWNITNTKTSAGKTNTGWWNGSFLNWLTMRRFDVMNKLLTGAVDLGQKSQGYRSCGYDNTLFKTFPGDINAAGTNLPGRTIYVEFDHNSAPCSGKNLSHANFYYREGSDFFNLSGQKSRKTQYSVIGDPPTLDGIIQRNLGKAQIGLAFYNEKGDGANIATPTKAIWGSNDYNSLKTPSQYNGLNDQPLANALFSVAGYFAQVANDSNPLVSTTTLGGCTTASLCGPYYSAGQNNVLPIGNSSDPYYQHGGLSSCTKGNVIILTDGEPCSDGNLPSGLAHYAESRSPFYCSTSPSDKNCVAVPLAIESGFHSATTIPMCTPQNTNVDQTDRVTGSLEDVALWAHTTDLRDTAYGNNIENSNGIQNLDIWIVRAFGNAQSNLLKYAAINGSFDTTSGGNPTASPPNYSLEQSYFESDDPYRISSALDNIFQQLLKRATSGTAASVLASGEGSGANLVQAVFYPRRRFFDQVIEWTGTLQNFWYYIDPFFGNSSIREDSPVQDGVLNLVSDNTVTFFFDPVAQVTKANSYANSSSYRKRHRRTPTVVDFEKVNSLWEAGKFLHADNAGFTDDLYGDGRLPQGDRQRHRLYDGQ